MKVPVIAVLAALSFALLSRAQNLTGYVLPPDASYVTVSTGRADLDAAVVSAIADWNACLIGAQIVAVPADGSPCAYPNQRSEIYFAPLAPRPDGIPIYGHACVETMSTLLKMQSHYVKEFDIQLNIDASWTPCDLRRIVLHELGHAIGLGHPDEIGIEVPSVMRSGGIILRPSLPTRTAPGCSALCVAPRQAALLEKMAQARGVRRPIKRQRMINSCQKQLDQIAVALFG